MNTKMKTLSLALMAISGLALAGTAAAACPDGPSVADGGAWSSASSLGGSLAIDTPGFDGTECRLDASLTQNVGAAAAFVRDDTPSDEGRYRAQFLVDADALTGQNLMQTAKIFGATTDNGFGGVSDVVRLTVFGNVTGTTRTLAIFTACEGEPSNTCSMTAPLTAGVNRIEIDWQKDASGSVNVWINNTNESSPTLTIDADNVSWGGVDFATLGLSMASAAFRASHLNNAVSFDEFDSRRTSFIGN